MKLPLAPLVGLVALLVACCSAQLSSDYLGMYNDYDLYGQGYGAEGYGQDYEDQPSDQKNSWNPYSAYYGDEYGDYFFKDPAEVAQDCTVGVDGKVTFAGTAACDVKLTGADKTVPNLKGGLDGVYTVTACESGRPLYTRQKSPKNEDRVLWYSTMFRDWDVTNGTAPKNDDVLMYGGRGGEETRPQFVLTDWHVASEFMKDFNGFEEYSKDARKTVKDISSTTGTSPIKDIDLEVELQRLHSSVDLNSYENKPVPRPPEDS
eukprot:jgi/Astpho2/9670/Aster-x0861